MPGVEGSDVVTAGESPEDAELAARIAALDVIEPPPGWVDRAVARWEKERGPAVVPPPRPWRRWRLPVAATVGAIALAAALILVPRCQSGRTDELVVAVAHDGPRDRAGEPVVGDSLSATAGARGGNVELRVYRDGQLVVRCPDGAGCTLDGERLRVTYRLDRSGRYQVVALWAATVPPPTVEGLALDLLRASEAGVRVERKPALEVR